jgi:hypothetical protein
MFRVRTRPQSGATSIEIRATLLTTIFFVLLQPDMPRGTMVVVPPHTESRKLMFYLSTWLMDLAARMLKHLEDLVCFRRRPSQYLCEKCALCEPFPLLSCGAKSLCSLCLLLQVFESADHPVGLSTSLDYAHSPDEAGCAFLVFFFSSATLLTYACEFLQANREAATRPFRKVQGRPVSVSALAY